MTAPPPERGRPAGDHESGWHGAEQADPYSDLPYDEARQPTADYPADDPDGPGRPRSRYRGPDPEAVRPPQRPAGRHSRGTRQPEAWPDGYGPDQPDDGRPARPDRGRPSRRDPGYGTPDSRSGDSRGRGWRGGRAQPAGGGDYGRSGYPDPAQYPDGGGTGRGRPDPGSPDRGRPDRGRPGRDRADRGGRDRPAPPPGRPAGYTDADRPGRRSGGDQFLSDSWYRDRPAARGDGQPTPGGPALDYDGRAVSGQRRPAPPPGPPAPSGPAGPRYRGPRADRGDRDSGYPRPDEAAQYEAAPSRQVPRGRRTWADYQDKPYQGAAYGYVSDTGRSAGTEDGYGDGDARRPEVHGDGDSDARPPEIQEGVGVGYGFTAALGNYRGPAEPDVEPADRAPRSEPVVYADPGQDDGWSDELPAPGRYERTRGLDLPDVLPTAGGAVDPSDTGQFAAITGQFAAVSQSSSVLRSSGVMAVGTLGSRVTGFLRTIAQSTALGIAGIAGAYNVSNTLPNVVYNLALGGILTSVIVPLIVNAKKRDPGTGKAYEQRMFTMITGVLLAITVVATLATVPIVHIYSDGSVNGATEHLTVLFAYFFIPQIFFYGMSSLIGAVLNTRNSFAAPMWTPILNNVVVIAVLGLYVALAGLHKNPATISPFEVKLLGLGTTLGVVVQTVALVPALRKVGFRWQPRTDFQHGEISEIGRMAGWMLCYIGATQIAFLITIKVAEVVPNSAGVTEYNYAWLLFQLPYAVVGISVITALLPRMSSHASAGQLSHVRTDFSSGIRLAATIVVPCSLVLAVLGPAVTRVFLAHGAAHPAQAHTMGVVFAVFCLGLLPYMIFQLQLRVFYSMHDSKTPALIGLVTMTVNIITNLLALAFLRHSANLVAGLGLGFGLANLLGSVLAWRILSIRMRGLDGHAVGQSLARMHVATLPAALVALLFNIVIGTGSFLAATATLILGGGGALVTYVLVARAMHIRELATVTRTLRARLGR